MKDDMAGEERGRDVDSCSLEGEEVGCDDDFEVRELLLAWHLTVVNVGGGMAGYALECVM